MAVLQTINECYLEEEWIRIFTDGSSNPGTGETGAGYYSVYFEGRLAVGAPLSNYDGEIAAVEAAPETRLECDFKLRSNFSLTLRLQLETYQQIATPECARTTGCRRLLDGVRREGWHVIRDSSVGA